MKNLINFVYPNLIKNSINASYFVSRTILTPKNIYINKISDTIIEKFSGEVHIYPNADSINSTENSNTDQSQIYSLKFLRSLRIPKLPSDELKLKVEVLIMLL